jgi:hypothetical protein
MRPGYGLLFALAVMLALSGVAAEPSTNATAKPGRRPLVVLKQTAIHGRVLLIMAEEELAVASDLPVQVLKQKDDEAIHKTVTDKDGTFTLPSLDVGMYRIMTGRLIMDLRVEDPANSKGKTLVPKTILIVMPEALTQ